MNWWWVVGAALVWVPLALLVAVVFGHTTRLGRGERPRNARKPPEPPKRNGGPS